MYFEASAPAALLGWFSASVAVGVVACVVECVFLLAFVTVVVWRSCLEVDEGVVKEADQELPGRGP